MYKFYCREVLYNDSKAGLGNSKRDFFLRGDSRSNEYLTDLPIQISGRRLILLHAFTKKTGKTPPAEIKAAERRMNEYLDNG